MYESELKCLENQDLNRMCISHTFIIIYFYYNNLMRSRFCKLQTLFRLTIPI